MNVDSPQILSYLNYRDYLKDFYQAKKAHKSDYSYRMFTNKAGVGSPSHLKMIMDGQRNLTAATIPKYVRALGLKTKKEVKLFELLVKYNQCKETTTKVGLFEELLKQKGKKDLSPLEKNQLSFLSKWYYVAIYVIVDIPAFRNDVKWIKEQLNSKVSAPQIKQALKDLEKLKLISKAGESFKQTGGALSAPDEVLDIAIHKYHDSMIDLGKEALVKNTAEEREFNGATLSIKKKNLPQLKKMIRAFRKEINEITSSEESADMVYQLNIQLFPLTKEIK
ncbi:MAG: TIGR02147 family protein [Bdellovibrionaceae bacterium]|jgi:uncharacterized protein (TIGR02147 family)|nr:TIGR02147 family protein [Pseudobdellovibrionaceae bacterium]